MIKTFFSLSIRRPSTALSNSSAILSLSYSVPLEIRCSLPFSSREQAVQYAIPDVSAAGHPITKLITSGYVQPFP
jgi:hypothetical protein